MSTLHLTGLITIIITTLVQGFKYTIKVSHLESQTYENDDGSITEAYDDIDFYCEFHGFGQNQNKKILQTKTVDITQPEQWELFNDELFDFDDDMDGNGNYELFMFGCGTDLSDYDNFLGQTEEIRVKDIVECNVIYSKQIRLFINGARTHQAIFIEISKQCYNYMYNDYKYPQHGGSSQNQQISINSKIKLKNILNVEPLCIYETMNEYGFSGYPIVDDQENAYFADITGFKSIDINTCNLNWRVNVSQLFNEPLAMPSLNTPALFINNNGEKAIVYGWHAVDINNIPHRGCYMAALRIDDGSLIWSTPIVDKLDPESAVCQIHGVVIDNNYGYGGVSNHGYGYKPPSPSYLWRGKVFKIDINTGEIIAEFYTLPPYDYDNLEMNGFYNGGSVYPIQSMIDDYFVFGTSNPWSWPNRVEECLLGNVSVIPIDNVYKYNMCGEDVQNIPVWRCAEKINLAQSIVILNKNTFELETVVPTVGVSSFQMACTMLSVTNKTSFDNNQYCSKFNLIPEDKQIYWGPTSLSGTNSDVGGVATYHYQDKSYVAVSQKNGAFYVIEVPSGEVKISKIVGPWGFEGGGSPFSMAVDEKNMIAIWSLRGNMPFSVFPYKYTMADGTIVCNGGSIHAIDLKTGYTLWQWINPYSYIGEEQCNDIIYNLWFPLKGECERAFDGTEMLSPNETVINVIKPPIDDLIEPWGSKERASNIGPVTINNNMVFIPTMTGEIYVHNILNGEYIQKFQCPDYELVQDDNTIIWNREPTRSGITMYDDKLLFYCGAHFVHPTQTLDPNTGLLYGQLVVMNLKKKQSKSSSSSSSSNSN